MPDEVHVGIVGAGLGGLLAAIAMRRAGVQVTVLEAAERLGEIGAGIQMTPNVARLLQRYGVDREAGDDLVHFTDLHLRRGVDGAPLGHTPIARVEAATGHPWWLVHRHHLHTALATVARRAGAAIHIRSRVHRLAQAAGGRVTAATTDGQEYVFDLVVGADGVSSMVRGAVFPHGPSPAPPSSNCAYRAVVPVAALRRDPLTRALVEDGETGRPRSAMDVWLAPTGYIISYPIAGGRDLNLVLSHFHEPPITATQAVDVAELRAAYDGYDARIRRVLDYVREPVARWPLLLTRLPRWANDAGNVVLMGDAAHSMTNHMAQGAATSMEDGAFLARCLAHVVNGAMPLAAAVHLYESARRPCARYKQSVSFLNGWLWHLPDGPAQRARDATMAVELQGGVPRRSANLYGDPVAVRECYGYDAEAHADAEIESWQREQQQQNLTNKSESEPEPEPTGDAITGVTSPEAERIVNWFLPRDHQFVIKPRL